MTRTRMSAPELPPIVDKDRSRPTSRSTSSKSSLHQMSAAVNSKNIYNRLKASAAISSNHSDSSLTGPDRKSARNLSDSLKNSHLRTASRNHSDSSVKGVPAGMSLTLHHRSPESTSSHPLGVVSPTSGQIGDMVIPPAGRRHQASRALSWCAAESSFGSTPRLETLFEKRDADNNNAPVFNTNDNNSSSNNNNSVPLAAAVANFSYNNKNHVLTNNNNTSPVQSENGTRKRESRDLAQLATPGMRERLQSEGGTSEAHTAKTLGHAQTGRAKLGTMRRSLSDHKLVDKKRLQTASLSSSNNNKGQLQSPVTSRDRTLDWKLTPTNGRQGAPASKDRMRRVNSVSVLNAASSSNHTQSRQDSVFADGNNDLEERSTDDSAAEDEERKQRIAEWLIGAESAEVPPEPDIDYTDDPPQTDTAVHIVHQED